MKILIIFHSSFGRSNPCSILSLYPSLLASVLHIPLQAALPKFLMLLCQNLDKFKN